MQDNDTKIKSLLNIWYGCLVDHHKDKDCHFYITKRFCAYRDVDVFEINHYGYLFEWNRTANTYEDAQQVLITEISKQVKETCEHALFCEECDYSADQVQQLKRMYTEYKELIGDSLG